jgi:hypothetical protein
MDHEEKKEKKPETMSIAGINLLVMLVYTIILAAIPDGLILDSATSSCFCMPARGHC